MDAQVEENRNVAWINERGAWWFYLLLLALAYWVCFVIGFPNDVAMSAVLIGHSLVTCVLSPDHPVERIASLCPDDQSRFWLIHWKKGSLLTWEDDSGKYDRLTYWEQIDGGREHTANRKLLRVVPMILLFLAYRATEGQGWLFYIDLVLSLIVIVPKLSFLWRNQQRVSTMSSSDLYKAAGFSSFR